MTRALRDCRQTQVESAAEGKIRAELEGPHAERQQQSHQQHASPAQRRQAVDERFEALLDPGCHAAVKAVQDVRSGTWTTAGFHSSTTTPSVAARKIAIGQQLDLTRPSLAAG